MTRAEILEYFKDINYAYNDCTRYDTLKRMLDELQESCTDAISRNAIIKTLNKMDRYVADELTLCDTERKFPKNEVFIVDDVYEEIVEQLPSVTPTEKVGHWVDCSNGWMCSACSRDCTHDSKYCPNCGAKMQEVEE